MQERAINLSEEEVNQLRKNKGDKMKTITRMFRIPVSDQNKLDEILERYHGHETKVYCKDGWISFVIYDYPGGCTYNGEVVW